MKKTYQFRDAQFMTGREKELVLHSWVRFLKHGLQFGHFSRRLYEHLHLHCGFIAHYDRMGFFRTYFEDGEDTVRFLSQFDKRGECRSVEYGAGWRGSTEYEDLSKAMIEEGSRYIPRLMDEATVRQRQSDLREAEQLAAKHGVELNLTD